MIGIGLAFAAIIAIGTTAAAIHDLIYREETP